MIDAEPNRHCHASATIGPGMIGVQDMLIPGENARVHEFDGAKLLLPAIDHATWNKQAAADRLLPGTEEEVREATDSYFALLARGRELMRGFDPLGPLLNPPGSESGIELPDDFGSFSYGVLPAEERSQLRSAIKDLERAPRSVDCFEPVFRRLIVSLGNPSLSEDFVKSVGTKLWRRFRAFSVDAVWEEDEPVLRSDHFEVMTSVFLDEYGHAGRTSWPNAIDTVPTEVVAQTLEDLEEAWSRLGRVFDLGRMTTPLTVMFTDLGEAKGQTMGGWPIMLNARYWSDPDLRNVRKPTAAHELFHQIQYSYGLSSRWSAGAWLTEGTACWCEAFVWKRISENEKLLSLFRKPTSRIDGLSYDALPFWLFFDGFLEAPQGECPIPSAPLGKPIEELLTALNTQHSGVSVATDRVIRARISPNLNLRNLREFFGYFCTRRVADVWQKGKCGTDYSAIRGPLADDHDPPLPTGLSSQQIGTISAVTRPTTIFRLRRGRGQCQFTRLQIVRDGLLQPTVLRNTSQRLYNEEVLHFVLFLNEERKMLEDSDVHIHRQKAQRNEPWPPIEIPPDAWGIVLLSCATLKPEEVTIKSLLT